MANHAGGWAPGALARFRSLDFIITMEGGLELVHVPVQPPRTSNLDPVVEAFEGLWLSTPEDCASEGSGPFDFDCERMGRQLHTFLGPRSTQDDLYCILFSLANVMVQLFGGEPLSLEILIGSVPTTSTTRPRIYNAS
jgi:hypothetical protein